MNDHQIYTAKISPQGQVTIPSAVREKIGVDKGEYIHFYIADGSLAITNTLPIEQYFGKVNVLNGARVEQVSKKYRMTFKRQKND